MTTEELRKYFLGKSGTAEDQPFDIPVSAFKVGGKIFALINCHEPDRASINLKYSKDKIENLRNTHDEIQPGYHMNKNHWNTVYLDGNLSSKCIKALIDISYDLVFSSLPSKKRKELLDI